MLVAEGLGVGCVPEPSNNPRPRWVGWDSAAEDFCFARTVHVAVQIIITNILCGELVCIGA